MGIDLLFPHLRVRDGNPTPWCRVACMLHVLLIQYSPASLIAPPWYNASPGKKSQGIKSAVQEIDEKGQGQEPHNG